jgi:small conductance mechanosensitive channel
LKEPAPSVGVSSLGESTITIAVEPWTSVADYGVAQGEVNQAILRQFRAHLIERVIQEVRIINAPNIALQA